MARFDVGDEVTGTVPETGDEVQGMYLGSQEVTRQGPTRALLFVDGKRVAVAYSSLEHVEREGAYSPQPLAALRKGMGTFEYPDRPGPNGG